MANFTPTGVEFVSKNLNQYLSNLKKADRAQQQLGTSVTTMSATFGKAAIAVANFAKFAAPAVFAGGLAVARESIQLARQQAAADAQLAAAVKSTGGAAGLTVKELKAMASELQNVTNFGDEATEEAQALLLTFTRIGGDVFPRATEAILDVSVAMNQGLKESTIQIGKALNEPISGLTALRRVGIQFTDQQEQQIRTFAETGRLAQAQAVILGELERQFGGSAEAARIADGNFIAVQNSLGDLKETIGATLIPAMSELNTAIIESSNGWIVAIENAKVFSQAADEVTGSSDTFTTSLLGIARATNPLIDLAARAGDAQYYFGEGLQASLEFLIDNTEIGQQYAETIAGVVLPTNQATEAARLAGQATFYLAQEQEAAIPAIEAMTDALGRQSMEFSENRRRQTESARLTGMAGVEEETQLRATGLDIVEIQAVQKLPELMKEVGSSGQSAATKIKDSFQSAFDNLKSIVEGQVKPTLDEVWQPPDDGQRIDEQARRLATVSTAGFSSEWLDSLNQQFAGLDFWQPVTDAIESGDETALQQAANDILANNVTALWDTELIKERVRQDLQQKALKQGIVDAITQELAAEGVAVPTDGGLSLGIVDAIGTGMTEQQDNIQLIGSDVTQGIFMGMSQNVEATEPINTLLFGLTEKLNLIHSEQFPSIDMAITNTASLWVTEFTRVNEVLQFTINLLNRIQSTLSTVAEAAKKAVEAMKKFKDAHDPLEDLIDLVEDATIAFKKMADAAREAAEASKSAGGESEAAGGVGFGGGMAEGGFARAGTTYLVGENGPELFTPRSSGNIIPNSRLGEVVADSGIRPIGTQSINVLTGANVTIQNGMDLAMLQNTIVQTVTEAIA